MTARALNRILLATLIAFAGFSAGPPIAAQEAQPDAEQAQAAESQPEPQPAPFAWQRDLAKAPIGDLAEIDLGESFVFLDESGTKAFLEFNQNPVDGSELATVAPLSDDEGWFLIFEFDDIGYVKDDEKDDLDANAMLDSIRKGTEAANEERKKRGWSTMEIVGWQEPPHYDARTNNLSWGVTATSEGHQSVNRIVKLLGRRGVMTVTLVASPEELTTAVPRVDTLLTGFRFQTGHTYAEFVPSTDKLAEYGLTALVVGGAGAALVKSGLFAKLWKPLVVGLAALGAGVKRMFFSGHKTQQNTEGPIG